MLNDHAMRAKLKYATFCAVVHTLAPRIGSYKQNSTVSANAVDIVQPRSTSHYNQQSAVEIQTEPKTNTVLNEETNTKEASLT